MNSFERDAVGRPETWSTTITSKLFLWLTVGMFVLTGLILFLMAGRGELSALGTGWVLLLSMLVLLAGVVVEAAVRSGGRAHRGAGAGQPGCAGGLLADARHAARLGEAGLSLPQ